MRNPIVTKTCPRCRRTLDSTQFYARAASNDGLAGYCKECQRSYAEEYKEAKLRRKGQCKVCEACNRLLRVYKFPLLEGSVVGTQPVCRKCVQGA